MTDWNKLKVVDLKAELKRRGLVQAGLKPALVARLVAAESEDGSESEATVQGDAVKPNPSSATSPDSVSPVQPSLDVDRLLPPQNPSLELSVAEPQPDSIPTQVTSTIESSELGQDANNESALPSVEPREAMEDRQKRKRRSQSPPPSINDVARKRARQEDGSSVSDVEHDAALAEDNALGDAVEANAELREPDLPRRGVDPLRDTNNSVAEDGNFEKGGHVDVSLVQDTNVVMDEPPLEEDTPTSQAIHEDLGSRARDFRFKGLFSASKKEPEGSSVDRRNSHDETPDAVQIEPDRVIAPAIHPATSALYIRDFMRPLNPAQLRSHLTALATPPGQDTVSDLVLSFYLDPIRTHAFVSFRNVSAASRVRSALHDRIWPDERTRKALWADFIPPEKVEQWTAEEQSTNAGGRAAVRKWEVFYTTDEDRHVTATLQEAGTTSRPPPTRNPSISVPVAQPLPSVGVEGAPSGPRAAQIRGQRAASNLSTLDHLFKSTSAKPLLYWQPVSKALANKRLDRMEMTTSKSAERRVGTDINRYTFEDGDVLVDRGPEIFSGIRPPPGNRGARVGGGGRGGAGGYHGRGGYGGGFERSYDAYRGDRRDPRDWRY